MSLYREVAAIADQLASFFRLPFATESIPGGFAEALIADHYGGEVLATYDFVDVICKSKQIGWQIKSTKATTTVTWKRAKIEGSAELIQHSDLSGDTSVLGAKIIETCNEHVQDSLNKYDLKNVAIRLCFMYCCGFPSHCLWWWLSHCVSFVYAVISSLMI